MGRQNRTRGKKEDRGQMSVEYAVIFTVIVAAIIYAATYVVKPSAGRFYNSSGLIFDRATNGVQRNFPVGDANSTNTI